MSVLSDIIRERSEWVDTRTHSQRRQRRLRVAEFLLLIALWVMVFCVVYGLPQGLQSFLMSAGGYIRGLGQSVLQLFS